MNNPWGEIQHALTEAKCVNAAADAHASAMANLLRGRLRHVSGSYLGQLKRELRDFDMRTYSWKDPT